MEIKKVEGEFIRLKLSRIRIWVFFPQRSDPGPFKLDPQPYLHKPCNILANNERTVVIFLVYSHT